MSLEIRTATVLDAKTVCAAVRRSITECCEADHRGDTKIIATWLENKTTENATLWIQEPGAIPLLALVDGNVVGFALSRNDQLALCYVVPEVLQKGVGKSLLRALELRTAMQGVTRLQLDSIKTAKDFYLRNGYFAAGPVVVWAGLECQPMFKNLEPRQPVP